MVRSMSTSCPGPSSVGISTTSLLMLLPPAPVQGPTLPCPHAHGKGTLHERLGEGPECEVRVRPDDPRDFHHLPRDDLCEVVVVLEPEDRDDVPLSGHRVDLVHAGDLGQPARHLLHALPL